ncbi:hypothetical protein STVA_17680 [Allostella vacuolata]|nr:hypothetical protein STVA_17680 [Stella vacuolata]
MEDREAEGGVGIAAELAPRVNIALHQNAIPVLRELAVDNRLGEALVDVELTLHSEPGFLKPRTWRIARIEAGAIYPLLDRDVGLDAGHLARLTEAEEVRAVFTLRAGGAERAQTVVPVELLPRNQWGGIGHLPEMVAAFVQPNDPAVERILKRAAAILHGHGLPAGLNGYQGDPRRAWELASAVWTAIGGLGLDYALPPASFEQAGQKVRSPSQILDFGLATCLDTTLLFAACLEQAGLNPLVVFTQGHAFPGLWLKAEEFPTAVVDDVTALRKRVKLHEIVLFETTLATHRPCPAFTRAAERAMAQIAEAEEDKFELAVDIRRCRMQRLRPLASADATPAAAEDGTGTPEPVFEAAPDLADHDGREDEAPTTPQGRLDRWQRKLLDLSLRNGLLNFRAGKKAMRIEAPDPGRLEDLLSGGRRLRLLPRPVLMEGPDPRSQAIHEERHAEDVRRAHALEALERQQLLVDLPAEEIDVRLVDLYRQARSALQEGGANTLYLAFGFLAWTRGDKADRRFKAPLILVPVTLERKSVRSGFTLLLHEDEPRFNPTLLEMLRQDFRLHLPIADGGLAKDQSGLDVAGLWQAISRAIKDVKGWEVTEEVVLSVFSFAKHLMWKDLVDRTDQLKQNPVVRHLIENPRDPYPSAIPFPDPRRLDRDHGPEETFCPLPADSSQLSAVMAASKGKDFVLVGPPGTGKSQTIANLVSQTLASGKTVLFVSEKIAALDVVYRRLRDVGLGDFCLELHSSKARKADVLAQLRRAWDARGEVDADAWQMEAARLRRLRDQLNDFVERLHLRRRNGLSVHAAIGRVVEAASLPEIGLSWPSGDAHDPAALAAMREVAERLDVNLQSVGRLDGHPLAPVARGDWSPGWQQALLAAAQAMIAAVEALEASAEGVRSAAGLPELPRDGRGRRALAALAGTLPVAAGRDWRFVLRPDWAGIADGLTQGLELVARHRTLKATLSAPWPEDLVREFEHGCRLVGHYRAVRGELSVRYDPAELDRLDTPALLADWRKAEESWWPMRAVQQRRVVAALAPALDGAPAGETGPDLERLARMRRLEGDIDGLDHLRAACPPWAGRDTDLGIAEAASRFQSALAAAARGETWSDQGLEAVAEGRCGPAAARDLATLRSLAALDGQIAALAPLSTRTGGLWAGPATNEAEVDGALRFRAALGAALADLAPTVDAMAALRPPVERLLGDGNPLLEKDGAVARAGAAYLADLAAFEGRAGALAELSGRPAEAFAAHFGPDPAAIVARCRGIVAAGPRLNGWCGWRKVRGEALALALAPLVAAIEGGAGVAARDLFEVAYARWWLNATVDGDPVLRNFIPAEHEKRIADFRALDDRFTALTRAYVRARLCGGLPDPSDVSRGSEWGLLKREMEKKKRHLPLRELVQGLPGALLQLTPCLLMSPLSIAQYLSTDAARFDLVVFDEASQIPVWDAVGAIARGRQVVMVGDPKQLPPTAFFERAEDEELDEEIEQDLESILDECLGANLPTINLSWHYRSRHESLIAFSNHRYYGGGLVTFPSPVTDDRAVSFHHVADGVYEKGGARINKPEARALVADLVARLRDPAFAAAGHSIGVVTFNAEQQKLIEDLLDEERRRDPDLEAHFADDRLEPVFVKNLENVQGDERDVMYFSITYGPARPGLPPSMNFGPMNRDGGQRRLNVAITRARQALRVFSSLTPDQMDLSRTQAPGVRDLKHFLEFADRGPKVLAEANFGSVGQFESPFEQAVARALAGRGWQVQPQVGVSAFRIDLGIVDPDAPGRYLAGVECDGATYHRSATARDRDKLREFVLRGLGWEIVRIWSTDWWLDPETALDRTDDALQMLLAASRAKPPPMPVVEPATAAPAVTDAEDIKPVPEAPVHGAGAAEAPPEPRAERQIAGLAMAAARPPALFREAQLDLPASPERFFEAGYEPALLAMIRAVVEAEGPIREDVLCRRIARAHGWARAGARIGDRVLALAAGACRRVPEDDAAFLWPLAKPEPTELAFRRPSGPDARPVDEIALPELAALARELAAPGQSADDAVTAMARAAGLQRLRAASRRRLELALAMASDRPMGQRQDASPN